MKKVTRNCCPVCGKNSWDNDPCADHDTVWKALQNKRRAELVWLIQGNRCGRSYIPVIAEEQEYEVEVSK